MNPVSELIKKLVKPQIKQGVIVDITSDSLIISVDGIRQRWNFQSGFQVNDSVIIVDGRLVFSPPVNDMSRYEV